MASWADLEASAPRLAEQGRTLLVRGGGGGMLATVAGSGLPRVHPVNVEIVDGRLMVFVQSGSSKRRDLSADGRFALHAHVDPSVPHEFLLRGRAREIPHGELRTRALEAWPFPAADGYVLFELEIERALFGERGDAEAWPPRYTSWPG
jgi:dipeptidyl aminopeptidase/acylaminoacyl peptidase